MGGEVLNLSSQGVGSLADVPLSGSTGTLVLSNNGLMALDGVVEDQPAVRKIWVDGNKLFSLAGVDRFPHLTELHMAHNRVMDLRPLGRLVSLQALDATANGLQRVSGVESLLNLRTLILSDNRISMVPSLAALRALKVLDLARNRIRTLDGCAERLPASLATLRLEFNQIEAPCQLTQVASLHKLTSLNIDCNPVAEIAVDSGITLRPLLAYWLPSLLTLDGVDITRAERYTADNVLFRGDDGSESPELLSLLEPGQEGDLLPYMERTCPISLNRDFAPPVEMAPKPTAEGKGSSLAQQLLQQQRLARERQEAERRGQGQPMEEVPEVEERRAVQPRCGGGARRGTGRALEAEPMETAASPPANGRSLDDGGTSELLPRGSQSGDRRPLPSRSSHFPMQQQQQQQQQRGEKARRRQQQAQQQQQQQRDAGAQQGVEGMPRGDEAQGEGRAAAASLPARALHVALTAARQADNSAQGLVQLREHVATLTGQFAEVRRYVKAWARREQRSRRATRGAEAGAQESSQAAAPAPAPAPARPHGPGNQHSRLRRAYPSLQDVIRASQPRPGTPLRHTPRRSASNGPRPRTPDQAAALLQARWRGVRTRRLLRAHRRTTRAAVVVQAAFRGHRARCKILRRFASARPRSIVPALREASLRRQERSASPVPARRGRSKQRGGGGGGEREVSEGEASLQETAERLAARCEALERRCDGQDQVLRRLWGEVAGLRARDAARTRQERNRAARRIQQWWRAVVARAALEDKREAFRDHVAVVEDAATVIQRAWRQFAVV